MTRVGAAVVEIPVPVGTAMAGYAARTEPSRGVHDPLTVRAITFDDLTWVTVDVCGLHEDTCAEIAHSTPTPDNVRVSATHTHAGPCVVPGRLGGTVTTVHTAIVHAAADAIRQATRDHTRADLEWVSVPIPDVAFDRRRDHPIIVDLQAIVARRSGRVHAALVTWPCHPVVLGAENLQISGDYPAVLRSRLEQAWPGAVVVFAAGCAGDINPGHASTSSLTHNSSTGRTFTEADRIGSQLASSLLTAAPSAAPGHTPTIVCSAVEEVSLALEILDDEPPACLAARWRSQLDTVEPGLEALLRVWIDWADSQTDNPTLTWTARISVSAFAGGWIVGLPGEPFLAVENKLRASLGPNTLVLGYTDGCPGYFPTRQDYASGGYEVREAHRYYGMPAPFRAGSAEQLVETALRLADSLGAAQWIQR